MTGRTTTSGLGSGRAPGLITPGERDTPVMSRPPPRSTQDPLILSVPLRGPCRVQNSPGSRIPSHGTEALGSSHAIDLVPVNEEGRSAPRTWRRFIASEAPEIFVGFGQQVAAPAAGTIVLTHDGEPDHEARRSQLALAAYMLGQSRRVRAGAAALAGNHVVIAISPAGPYVLLAHLQRGSVRVRAGQRISDGAAIAECGNSGNSTEPHLHLQVSDSTDWASARGLPFVFRRSDGSTWLPTNGQIVRA